MKKLIAFLMILIIVSGCSGVVLAYETVEYMRIGIYYGTNAREEYTLECPNGFDIGYYEGRDFVKMQEAYISEIRVTLGAEGGNYINVSDPQSGETIYTADTSLNGIGIEPRFETEDDRRIKITAKASGNYRGGFEFFKLSGEGITAVNVVSLDSYLYGVISREMSPSWPKEALKAQAVCARNFALTKLNRHKDNRFDLCNTVCCQAYSGIDYEAEGSFAPVDETSGEVLLYEDELVQAVYSSSMGYCTEDVKNVWGSNFPYLVSVSNEYEDTQNVHNGVWEKTLTCARATEIMNSRGYDIGEVTDITALEYTDAGRVLRLEVKGTKGSKIFERESCRTIFSEVTLSQMYKISGGGKTIYPQIYVLGADGKKAISLDNSYILGKGEVKAFYATNGEEVTIYQGTAGKDSFVFSGQGWGHGVGMSQYGAKGMAEAGFDYEEILTHYYTGTHLEKLVGKE